MDSSENPGQNSASRFQSKSKKDFLTVGIGASAGGVKALKEFFAKMPADSGMAFAVVLHLSQTHESNLAEILGRETQMPVIQVTEAVKVEPNHVYVIPPAKGLEMIDGLVRVTQPQRSRGARVAIDRFFRTLADAYGASAVGIVLSGTGEDGTLGLKKIKEANGFAIVQDPADAQHDQMPRSAMATGLVDWVLHVEQMPEKLHSLRESSEELGLTTADDGVIVPELNDANALREIFAVLRVRTGHDFSSYKQLTLLRRIARHLQIHELENMRDYAALLQERPEEAEFLLTNLLINVTNFFRDPEAFYLLENDVIPRLFAGKTSNDVLRVWVAACATGEEAYSIAMLLCEYASRFSDVPKIQIFATDIDDDAIAAAREGFYGETSCSQDVSPARLRRFFTKEGNGFRVKKSLREMILFTPHNILRDPPFSKVDLISCRNLLIYLNREAQERLMHLFHFALQSNGFLFLGTSESAESLPVLFSPYDKKQRIYLRRPTNPVIQPSFALPLHDNWQQDRAGNTTQTTTATTSGRIVSFNELHFRLLEKYAPPSLLVNEEHDIVHLTENVGRYLQFVGGEPTSNLLKVVHPALRADLRAALFTARQDRKTAETPPVRLEVSGENCFVQIKVQPVEAPAGAGGGFSLVIFEESKTGEKLPAESELIAPMLGGNQAMETIVRRLEDELRRTKDQLRSTIEQHETSIEELKASNEELQSINEELRSATEELETSREELQSVNEELTTVNYELKENIEEVSRSNSDLQNLIHSTDLGTIFLDRQLQVKRFTPSAQDIFKLIPSDLGRRLDDLTNRLNYPDMTEDALAVLRKLRPIEREVQSDKGQFYLARLLPYRTSDDKIDGVVLTFLDITERKQAEKALRESEERLQQLIKNLPGGAAFVLDCDLRYLLAEGEALADSGFASKDFIGKTIFEAPLPSELATSYAAMYRKALAGESFTHEHDGHGGAFLTRGIPLRNTNGEVYAVLAVSYDISDRKKAEERVRESEERMRLLVESVEDYAIFTVTPDNLVNSWNPGGEQIFGYTEDEILGQSGAVLFTPEDRERGEHLKEINTAIETGRAANERYHLRKDGTRFYASGVLAVLGEDAQKNGFVKICRDLTERRQMEEALRDADQRKDEFLATLAHELRNPLAPIRSGLEVMRRGENKMQDQNAREIIERQTDQLVHLVDDLLDISRITQGKIKLRKQQVNIADAIKNAVETVQPFVENLRHRMDVRLPDAPVFVEADPTRLTQIVQNLLHNSAKYTEPGGHILLIAAREADEAVIRVRDNGVGIQFEMLPKIFDMFAQIESSEKRGQGGLGIGLSLVKKLVEMHGGTVEAHSEGEEKGSEFIVRLPLSANQKPKVVKQTIEKTEKTNNAVKTRRILVVDDNADAASMLEVLLTMDDHQIRTAFNGRDALEKADEFEPDTAILDIGLPDIDGHKLAKRLREQLPEIYLIALSGWGQTEDLRRSDEAGFNHHLVKPVDVEELKKLLT
jgi:two-component system CheB/CheR fusion protein